MQDFTGRIAVVTGGASGMGRELVRQLAAEGCHVAACDLSDEGLAETARLAHGEAPAGTRITIHHCDVADEPAVVRFRDEVIDQHTTDHVHLVFNNAGIGGGGSMFTDSRERWERTFDIVWGGVYLCTRAFLPLLAAAPDGHIVNTSSVNGFFASIGPERAHTAYSAAKFAVKGFTEALMTDLALNAPHVHASVVMPGHIGTSIVANSATHGGTELSSEHRQLAEAASSIFETSAPTSAADAASVILDGVRADRWRILIGDDARALDEAVRSDPEGAYEPDGAIRVLRQAAGNILADDG